MISVDFLTKLMLNSEMNLICTSVKSQCDKFFEKKKNDKVIPSTLELAYLPLLNSYHLNIV